jgi:type VI secretion system secreted protein VgrG
MRPFDGIVTSARWAGVGENGHRYDLTLRPWFWLAGGAATSGSSTTRPWSDPAGTAVGLCRLGDPALEIKLSQGLSDLEYTVQYRESDLDFARRQMERHGISFHFRTRWAATRWC